MEMLNGWVNDSLNENINSAYTNTSPYAYTNTYINEDPFRHVNNIEDFNTITISKTNETNSKELQEQSNLSANYAEKINRYNTEYPSLLTDTRVYSQRTDRTKNFKENTDELNKKININYNITADKVGCYKNRPDIDIIYQPDMNDVTLDTCTQRTFDLEYDGFSIKKKSDGKLGCYVTNDIEGIKSLGVYTKPKTSFAFKTHKNAVVGGLLPNGQLGIYNGSGPGSVSNILATDLTAIPGCNVDGSKHLINPNSVTATWGSNCVNYIKSEFNNKCIHNPGTTNKYLQMQLWDCLPGNSRQNMVYNNDTQNINTPGTNLCLDVLAGGTANGTKVIQYNCNGTTAQKWTYGMDKTLQPHNAPGKCLDLLGGNNAIGASLGIWDCHGQSNQKWNITRNGVVFAPIPPPMLLDTSKKYNIKSIQTNRCIYNNRDGRFNTYNCSNYNDQLWIPYAVPGQQYTFMFKSVDSNLSLYSDTNGKFRTDVSNINNPAQQWKLIPVNGQPDTYQLFNNKIKQCIINNDDGRFKMAGCVADWKDQWWKILPKM